MKKLLSLFACGLLFAATGDEGLAATTSATVAELSRSFVPGDRVVLKGRFLSKVNFETILFEDETGRVEVILDDHPSVSSRLLDPAFLVLVSGEVGSGYQQAPIVRCDAVEVVSHDPAVVAPEVDSTDPGQNLSDRISPRNNRCADVVADQGAEEVDSVKKVLSDGCPGQEVTIVGSFVDQVNYETLLFRDRTGDIEVVISDEDMLLLGKVSGSEPVQLTGEVMRGYRDAIMLAFVGTKKNFAKD